MSKLITVTGRSLSLSGKSHPNLNYKIEGKDTSATTTSAEGKQILLQQIQLQCDCSGDYGGGNTFQGKGNASIVASSQTVKCEDKPIVLAEDKITITCSGTVTPSAGASSPGEASVTITVTDTNQTTVLAR